MLLPPTPHCQGAPRGSSEAPRGTAPSSQVRALQWPALAFITAKFSINAQPTHWLRPAAPQDSSELPSGTVPGSPR